MLKGVEKESGPCPQTGPSFNSVVIFVRVSLRNSVNWKIKIKMMEQSMRDVVHPNSQTSQDTRAHKCIQPHIFTFHTQMSGM